MVHGKVDQWKSVVRNSARSTNARKTNSSFRSLFNSTLVRQTLLEADVATDDAVTADALQTHIMSRAHREPLEAIYRNRLIRAVAMVSSIEIIGYCR